MGSISLTAVNAFGNPRAAQLASARLVERGYPVVAAARLGEIAVRNGLLAIIGAAQDHERMIAISTRMHDRVAALAVVGGPLAIFLGQHEGLTVPTLVVSDRVGRRDRRRIVRRLPRGSMLVRAVDFDAALDAVVTFLDRTAEGRRQPIRSGTLRPVALRLAPAAFFAPAAAVMFAGSGADAAADCTHDQANGLLTITCDGDGADLTLGATSDDLILLDGEEIAKLSEIQKISILTTGGDDKLTIDQLIDKFRSGPEGAAIAFDVDGGGGLDELKLITGLPAVQLTADKISLSDAEQKVIGEIKYAGFDTFSYLGDATASKMEIDGLNFSKLELDGGGGGDALKLISGDSLIGISDSAISLNFAKIDIQYKEYSELSLIGDETASKIEIADFTGLVKLSLDGGGGLDDELKLSTGESLLTITDLKIAPGDLNRNPIEHTGFESLSVLAATDINNTFDGSEVETLKLTLDGGSGDDVLFGGELDDLLTGGLGSNKISGGGGIDTLVEAVDGNFVASNNTLSGAARDAFSSIEALKLTGGASDNSFNTEPFKGKVTLDGGAGNDRMISGPGADVLIGGAGIDSLNGGQGDDTLLAGDGDDTLNGGPGHDFGDGGDGIDTGKSIEDPRSIER